MPTPKEAPTAADASYRKSWRPLPQKLGQAEVADGRRRLRAEEPRPERADTRFATRPGERARLKVAATNLADDLRRLERNDPPYLAAGAYDPLDYCTRAELTPTRPSRSRGLRPRSGG